MKLSDWLPILTHPEVGERICEAAGLKLSKPDADLVGNRYSLGPLLLAGGHRLPVYISAALASGTLAVLAGDDGEGWLVCFDATDEHGNGDWTVMDYEGYKRGYGPTLPAAVLDAARRVYGKEGE